MTELSGERCSRCSVSEKPSFINTPPPSVAELPLTVQLVSVIVPPASVNRPPPYSAELPLTVQSVSVSVPPSLYRPPPVPAVLPPVIVRPEIDAVTFASTWNTRLSPPPLTVTPAAGPVIVSVPVVSLSSSWRRQRDRLGVAKTVGSKVIVWAPAGHWPG